MARGRSRLRALRAGGSRVRNPSRRQRARPARGPAPCHGHLLSAVVMHAVGTVRGMTSAELPCSLFVQIGRWLLLQGDSGARLCRHSGAKRRTCERLPANFMHAHPKSSRFPYSKSEACFASLPAALLPVRLSCVLRYVTLAASAASAGKGHQPGLNARTGTGRSAVTAALVPSRNFFRKR